MEDKNPGNHFTQQDRETMIRQTINMENLRMEVKTLISTIDWRFHDHEERIRVLEKSLDNFSLVRSIVFTMVWLICVTVIGALISWAMK